MHMHRWDASCQASTGYEKGEDVKKMRAIAEEAFEMVREYKGRIQENTATV